MELSDKIRTLPTGAGCYLYKNAEGEVIYVGKAKNLRSRVRSYFLKANQIANAKTGSLMREAVDLEYILVANEREALALENNLIKQRKPRFNILLRDDKTYPYIKLTLRDRHPKVFVTRKLRKDGSAYFGPYFPGNLAYRLVDVIHRSFLIPSCKVDLNRYHPRACLQYYIKRCLGPCVESFVTPTDYAQAIRDVQLFLEGNPNELEARLTERMAAAAEAMQFELAARLRDQLITVSQAQDKQRIASADDEDADVFGFHYENDMLAVNLFHMRAGKIVDRRELFWEELPELDTIDLAQPDDSDTEPSLEPDPSAPAADIQDAATPNQPSVLEPFDGPQPAVFSAAVFFSALLKQMYLDQAYVPKHIYVPVDFPDRALLADALRERCGKKIEIAAPQRGDKRSLVDLVCQNAKQSYDQRFRVLQPSIQNMQEALQDALMLAEPPERIECFDISHIQGSETVASMVVWEKGSMKKSDYRKFQVKTVSGVDDFASMREIIHRRYKRLQEDNKPMPSLVLIDGGLGQLHAAADALEEIGLTTQPLASIAKREEIIYVHGQEDDPVILDRRSPVLHVIQKIRDESHRFAVTYHRKRRQMRDRTSELDDIPGVGTITRNRLIEHFGSVRALKQTAEKNPDALTAVVNKATAEKIRHFFLNNDGTSPPAPQPAPAFPILP
ncbi:MAG: excinuclease ABC subunit C [Acidobacteria bacterium]|nr:excinuclease ABC subunit C [Acidobacteriota bacterium]